MPDYVAAVCHPDNQGELVPAEDTDNEAIQKAVAWRVQTISGVDPDRKAWLQVLHDGVSVLSREIGRVF